MTHELSWNTSMMVSAIILVLTFLGIFTEGVHGFHRTKFAMLGAGLMIFAGFGLVFIMLNLRYRR